jgi:hypothetical protein
MRRSRSNRGPGSRLRGSHSGASSAWLAGLVALAWPAAPGCATAPVGQGPASCPADRAVVLASQADVARFAACPTARDVTIRSGAALDVSRLGALTAIAGDLVVGPTVAVDEVALRGLRTVDGAIRMFGNGALQGLYLPRLERAGAIAIDGNAALTSISLPRLVAVAGGVQLTDNANLELVDLAALATVGGELAITGNPRLALVQAERLRSAARLQLDAPKLPAEVAAQLRAVAPATAPQ